MMATIKHILSSTYQADTIIDLWARADRGPHVMTAPPMAIAAGGVQEHPGAAAPRGLPRRAARLLFPLGLAGPANAREASGWEKKGPLSQGVSRGPAGTQNAPWFVEVRRKRSRGGQSETPEPPYICCSRVSGARRGPPVLPVDSRFVRAGHRRQERGR